MGMLSDRDWINIWVKFSTWIIGGLLSVILGLLIYYFNGLSGQISEVKADFKTATIDICKRVSVLEIKAEQFEQRQRFDETERASQIRRNDEQIHKIKEKIESLHGPIDMRRDRKH